VLLFLFGVRIKNRRTEEKGAGREEGRKKGMSLSQSKVGKLAGEGQVKDTSVVPWSGELLSEEWDDHRSRSMGQQ
jgi:hypothetical protein